MNVSFSVYIQKRVPSNNQIEFKMQIVVRIRFVYHPDQYFMRNQVVLTLALGDSLRER